MKQANAEGCDLEDVRRAQAGDVAAFERLYREHLPRVHRIARWLLGTDDVDDVIQDVFVRVWSKLATFNGRSTVETWINRVATNVVLRHREKLGRRAGREVPLESHDERVHIDRLDLRLDIEAAVSGLPERARIVFVLHEIQGLTHEEISKLMGTTSITCRTQLHRARQMIRSQLSGDRR